MILCRSADRRSKERAMHDKFSQRIEEALQRLAARLARAKKHVDPAVVNRADRPHPAAKPAIRRPFRNHARAGWLSLGFPPWRHLQRRLRRLSRRGSPPQLCCGGKRTRRDVRGGGKSRPRARSCTAPPRPKSAGDARSPRDARAPFRHDESAHGRDPLSDENAAEGRHRNGAQCARLQSHGRHEYRWHKSPDRGNRSVSHGRALSSISAAPMRPGGLILNA